MSEVDTLVALDALDRGLHGLQTDIERANQALVDAALALTEKQARTGEANAALEANRDAERQVFRRLQELRASRNSAVRILETGAGSPEAAQRQLENCDALIDTSETAMLELLEAQDKLVAGVTAAEFSEAVARQTHTKLSASTPGTVAAATASHAAQLATRPPIVEALPPEIRQRYQAFRDRSRWAVAQVIDDSCGSCARTVQAQMGADLRKGRLVACHGCHRWLAPPS